MMNLANKFNPHQILEHHFYREFPLHCQKESTIVGGVHSLSATAFQVIWLQSSKLAATKQKVHVFPFDAGVNVSSGLTLCKCECVMN